MNKKIYIIIATFAALLTVSCVRDEILYPTSNYYLAFDLQHIVEKDADAPQIYMANFYNTVNGKLEYQEIIRPLSHPPGMPVGGYIQGITPGQYHMVVYNFDSKKNIIENENNYDYSYAHTKVLSYNGSTPIVITPDNLYVHSETVDIKYVTGENAYIIDCEPQLLVETWKLNVNGIKNIEKLVKMTVYVSGQVRGKYIKQKNEKVDEKVIICFDATPPTTKAGDVPETFSINYQTYGQIENGQRILVTVIAEGPDGSTYYAQKDITEQILDPSNENKEVDIDADFKIEERKQGGFDPSAREWDENRERWEIS